jgi:hypothetical protein
MWLIILPLDVPNLTASRLPRDPGSQRWNYVNPILDVPTFTTSRLPRDPSSERWNCVGQKWPMKFAWNARLPRSIQGSFTCRKSTTWDRRLYFPSEGRLRSGLNPRTWVPKASMLPLVHRTHSLYLGLQWINRKNFKASRWQFCVTHFLCIYFPILLLLVRPTDKHRVKKVTDQLNQWPYELRNSSKQ